MAVLAVWIVDTEKRVFHVMTSDSSGEICDGLATVPGTPVKLDVLEAFSTLDE